MEAHLAAHLCATKGLRGGGPPQDGWPPEALWRTANVRFVGKYVEVAEGQIEYYQIFGVDGVVGLGAKCVGSAEEDQIECNQNIRDRWTG